MQEQTPTSGLSVITRILAPLLLVLLPLWAQAVIRDVPNGPVYAVAVGADGTSYLGGDFTALQPDTGNGAVIAQGTGDIDRKFPKVVGSVLASVPDGTGGWYIGGNFTQVDGVTRNRLAHILSTGELDPAWAPSANSDVSALAMSGSTIYAGGDFSTIGGTARNRLAAIGADGTLSSWNPNANGYVSALAISGSTVYVGGNFTTVGGTARQCLAAVGTDGTLGSWNPGADKTVYTLAISGSTVYAGGIFTSVNFYARNRLAAIDVNGTVGSWNPNPNGDVDALAISGSTVYVGGNFTTIGGTARNYLAAVGTDGTPGSWNPNPNAPVVSLAASSSTVYAGGRFTTMGGTARNNLAAIDASGTLSSWNPNPDGWVFALALSGSTVYVGGTFSTIGDKTPRNYLAAIGPDDKFSSWNPNASGTVRALAMSGSTLYAGGDFTTIGGTARNRLAAIDVNGTLGSWNPNANNTVNTLAVSGSTVYAGGYFTTIGGTARNYLAAISTAGTLGSWNPYANGYVNALALSGSTVYAGGYFTTIGGIARNRLAAIGADGTLSSWSPNANNNVNTLAVSGSTVYAGGRFTTIGGTARNYLAAIDASGAPSSWSPNPNDWVYALALSGSTVYAGGFFSTIGGTARNRLAAIDASGTPSSWNPNPNGYVGAIVLSGSTVYAGGGFNSVVSELKPGSPSAYYSRLNRALTDTVVPAAPTGVSATGGNLKAMVSWTAPTDTGGAAITGYSVTASPGSKTCTTATLGCTVTGLTNGIAYTFSVTATNSVGTGPASTASNPVTPAATVPAAPTGVSATGGNLKAMVSWTAPTDTGGAAITGYSVTATPGNQTCTTATPGCTVTGLTNGIAYTFSVTATNSVGTGPASTASSPVTPATTVPAAPTGVSATGGNLKATVSWTAPTDTGGAAITGYSVTATPGNQTCTTATLGCTVTGLTNGIAYTFSVTATNSVGTGPASTASNPVTPATTVPAAPTGVSATGGNLKAMVSWTAPTDTGGAAITGYSVTASPGSKTCTTATLGCTVTGLTNGIAYTFSVTATNSVGTGPASTASSPVTPAATVPAAPTGVSATGGNLKAMVSWTAPTDTGGAAIPGYSVTASPGNQTCTTATLGCTVTGLTNGIAYTFSVTATNSVGTGPASTASSPVTPAATVPAAPTGVSATGGNLKAMVSWTAPTDTGGAAITGYSVTATPGNQTCTTATLGCTVTGLTNGTAYTFSVTATNSVGTGPASTASSPVTPYNPLGTPGKPVGTAGNQKVSVSWDQPTSGSQPVSYTVTAIEDPSKSCTIPFPGSAFTSASCDVLRLTNGQRYTFVVQADNEDGHTLSETSEAVEPVGVINGHCGDAADAATLVEPIAFLCSAGVATTVESDRGAYKWSCSGSGGGTPAQCSAPGAPNVSGGTSTFVAPNVQDGGCAIQQASLTVAPGGGPELISMPYGVVDFELNACQGSHAAVKLTYSQIIEGMYFWKYINNQWIMITHENSGLEIKGNTATFDIEDNGPLDANPEVGVIADPAGPGAVSLPAVPGAPINPAASGGSGMATVSWTAPDSGGAPVRYTVKASANGQTCDVLAPQTSCTVTGLTDGTAYTFTVVAENAGGLGAASVPSNSVTPTTENKGIAGLCGSAHGEASLQSPVSSLCLSGSASTVTTANGGYSWTCQPIGNASASQCRAPGASITGGAGTVSFGLVQGSGCQIETAELTQPPVAGPKGGSVPFGVVSFNLANCEASTVTVNMTFSNRVEGLVLWKWMRQTWTTNPSAVLSGNTATFSIEDNGPYDASPVRGVISDPTGPGWSNGKFSQPTLSLKVRKTTLKSKQYVPLNIKGGRGRGKIRIFTESSGGAKCIINTIGNVRRMFLISKTNGASCSVWAVKDADNNYNATISNSVTVRVSGN